MRKALALALVCSAITTPLWAQQSEGNAGGAGRLRPFITLGMTSGGSTVFHVQVTPVGSTTVQYTDDLYAGGGLLAQVGLEYRLPDSPFAIQGSLGWHNDQSNDQLSSGRYAFRRNPVELGLVWSKTDRLRFGGGLHKSINPAVTISNGTSVDGVYKGNWNERFPFTSKLGVYVETEYALTESFAFKLRYVHETFKFNYPDGSGSDTYGGGHIGLVGVYYFN